MLLFSSQAKSRQNGEIKMNKVVSAIGTLIGGFALGSFYEKRKCKRTVKQKIEAIDHNYELFLMMNQWVMAKVENNEFVSDYLKARGYNSIAIYGMSYAGKTLIKELNKSDIDIAYGIDRAADEIVSEIKIINADDSLPAVDAVIVTSVFYFDEIEKKLRKKINCPIISMIDVVYQN